MVGAMDERRPVRERVEHARKEAATTPGRLRVFAISISVAAVALMAIGTGALLAAWLNATAMQLQIAPAMVGMQHLHAWLSDADRSVGSGYLAGGAGSDFSQLQYSADIAASNFDPLGRLNPDDPQQRYAADIVAASRQLERATQQGVGGDQAVQKLQEIAVQVGNYAQQVQAANATDIDPATRTFRLQSASNLMHGQLGILAQVDSVGDIYAKDMDRDNLALQVIGGVVILYAIVALVLLVLLFRTQRFVRARFRRRRNHRLLAATLLLVVVAGGTGLAAARAAQSIYGAHSVALMRLQNLWTARSLVYDANGNAYLSLIAPGSAGKSDQAFRTETAQLVDRPLTDQLLRDAAQGQVGFNGMLADELRMAGSDSERQSALNLLTAFQKYVQADAAVRDQASHGNPRRAAAIALGADQGQLMSAFSQLDWHFGVSIQAQQQQFDSAMSTASVTLEVAGAIAVFAIAVALLAYWGLSPRMSEYTAGATSSVSASKVETRGHGGLSEAGT
jgi:hypothetical protein